MLLSWTHGTNIGYARYGTMLAAALARAGVQVTDGIGADRPPEHLAVWVSTPNQVRGFFDGQHKVLCTMWETDRLPGEVRQHLHNFDQLIVPSEQNRELFARYHPDVAVVPLGVDGTVWAFRARRPPKSRFVFLCAGHGPRKGLDVAIAAFKKVFGDRDRSPRPVLMVKSPRPTDGAVGHGIVNVTGWLTDAEEVDLYAQAHCFLAPSRGEGFGLMPLQALAQGLPTILTAAHGHAAFAHLGYPVAATETRALPSLYGDTGQWWEPDLDQLCENMAYVYDNYETAAKEAEQVSFRVHRDFSWDRCATATLDAIGRHHLDAPYTGDGRWQTMSVRRYPVQVSRFWACQVGGVDYQFHPGRTYWETAELKRILYQTGVLDPACVDPDGDHGLTDDQAARLGDYTAAHAYCHACGQRLGSGETRPA
jgi:glycosyltransferase involved in cell wall biosynthesis